MMTAKIRLSVCMALVSILINHWPVMISGRTIGERDGETQSQVSETTRRCHTRLYADMRIVCKHGFYTPDSGNSRSSNRIRNRRGFSSPDTETLPIGPRRHPRSIVDECCTQPCSLATLAKYCSSNLQLGTATTVPPPTQAPSTVPRSTTTERAAVMIPSFIRWYWNLGAPQAEVDTTNQTRSRPTKLNMPRPHRPRLHARDTSIVPTSKFMRFHNFEQITSDETQRDRVDELQDGSGNGNGRNSIQRRQLSDSGNNDLGSGREVEQSTSREQPSYPSSVQMITEESFPEPVALSMGLNDQFYTS